MITYAHSSQNLRSLIASTAAAQASDMVDGFRGNAAIVFNIRAWISLAGETAGPTDDLYSAW